jgi:diguanylate cyclase (GGDEF)-like protein
VKGKYNRPTFLIGKPSRGKYLDIQSDEILQRGHERALRAGERMQVRAERALKQKFISPEEYFRVRKAIEKKQNILLSKIKAQSKRLSERDPKFGVLYNAKKSTELAVDLLKKKGPSSFLILDVDHFKRINDKFGHDVGDVALRLLATVSNNVARKMSGFVGRIGGEEFLVGLPGNKGKAIQFIRFLNRELLSEFKRNETVRSTLRGELYTFSSGIVEKGEGAGFDALFKLADQRLYSAKELGRNRMVFDAQRVREIRRT